MGEKFSRNIVFDSYPFTICPSAVSGEKTQFLNLFVTQRNVFRKNIDVNVKNMIIMEIR